MDKSGQSQHDTSTGLLVSREEAEQRIEEQITKGRELQARNLTNPVALEVARSDFRRWSLFNAELLRQLFDSPAMAREYDYSSTAYRVPDGSTFGDIVRELVGLVEDKINLLLSVQERLAIMHEQGERISIMPTAVLHQSRDVFLVHGHNTLAREAVARLLLQLNLTPIILGEEPNAGRTIVEKLEQSSDVAFAVVLLTGDDKGGMKEQNDLSPRARQNVILELGYFMGTLGRRRVCAVYEEGVELPSDLLGIGYVALDFAGLWRFKLAKELDSAGIQIDLRKVTA